MCVSMGIAGRAIFGELPVEPDLKRWFSSSVPPTRDGLSLLTDVVPQHSKPFPVLRVVDLTARESTGQQLFG
jgi:hypothetical protein